MTVSWLDFIECDKFERIPRIGILPRWNSIWFGRCFILDLFVNFLVELSIFLAQDYGRDKIVIDRQARRDPFHSDTIDAAVDWNNVLL